MTQTSDAIVIGAGIMGTATAFELAKLHYRPVVVDKLPAAGYGSTGSSCAVIRTHYSTLDGVAIAYEGYFHWVNWADHLGVTDERGLARYINTGGLILGHISQKILGFLRNVGVPYELWDMDMLSRMAPYYDQHDFWPPRLPDDPDFFNEPSSRLDQVVYVPSTGYINDPQLSVHNLQRAAEAHGARFIFNRSVAKIHRNANRVSGVTLDDGSCLDAPVVVNAAGPHSFVVNRMADVEKGMNIKTRALRHEVHFVPAPAGVDILNKGYVVSDHTLATYHRPEAGNLILVGSMDPECDPKMWIENPDQFNRQTTTAQWRSQVYRLARRIPGVLIPNSPKGLAELYDVSDDWIPIYDKSSLDGFYMAVGTSGNQYKNGPVVGQLMAALIDACENGHDHDTRPLEFKTVYTRQKLNIGFYSRLRRINPDSSFSVVG
jgi:sarcosine oxidase subunit beta